jgi:hypothetical protein
MAELLPLAVRVIEYQMGVRRGPACGKRIRVDLPTMFAAFRCTGADADRRAGPAGAVSAPAEAVCDAMGRRRAG